MRFQGTKNFKIEELEASSTAKIHKIDNTIPDKYMANAENLLKFLQGIRDAWGSGIKISSGYRCQRLNRLVGGVASSAHTTANAADLVPVNGKMEDFKKFMVTYLANKRFDQCIIERKGSTEWIHVGFKNNYGMQRHQIFKMNVS